MSYVESSQWGSIGNLQDQAMENNKQVMIVEQRICLSRISFVEKYLPRLLSITSIMLEPPLIVSVPLCSSDKIFPRRLLKLLKPSRTFLLL